MSDTRYEYTVRLYKADGSTAEVKGIFEGPDLCTLIDWFKEWTLYDCRLLGEENGIHWTDIVKADLVSATEQEDAA